MTELSLKIRDRKLIAQIDADDVCISELVDLFRGLLVGHGYIDESYINNCKELVEEWK